MSRSRVSSSVWLWACFAAVVAVALSLVPWRPEQPPASDIQAYADATVAGGVPGVAIVVNHGASVDSLVTAGDFSPDSELSVASLSKAFTAIAVMQLVERSEISLDDPVQQHLPTFSLDDPRASEITVRQVLNQSTGLTDQTLGFNQYSVDPGNSSRAMGLLEGSHLAYAPGTSWDYCNVNYWIATALVESVTGKNFGEYLNDEMLAPLGMSHTRYAANTGSNDGKVSTHSWAFGNHVALPAPRIFTAGAGGVVTTIDDLGRWLRFQHGDGNDVLSRASLEEMQRRQSPLRQYKVGYALGWWSGEPADGGVPRTSHSGSGAGMSAYAGLFPGGVSIGVLVNSSSPRADNVAADVLSIIDGQARAPQEAPAAWPDVVAACLAALVVLAVVRSVPSAIRRERRRFKARLATVALFTVSAVVFAPAVLGAAMGRQVHWIVVLHSLPVPTISLAVVVFSAVALAIVRTASDLRSYSTEAPGRSTRASRTQT